MNLLRQFIHSTNIHWVICCCSVAQSVWLFATPWTAACQASLSFNISWSLLKLMSIELVIPSNHLLLCHSLLLLQSFPASRVFSNESAFCIRWPKYWSFSFSISLSNEYSGLIFFRMDWLDILAVQGTLKSLLQHTVWKHQFFRAQPSLCSTTSIHDYWKNHSFDYTDLYRQSNACAFEYTV